jgi:hypothetical protein
MGPHGPRLVKDVFFVFFLEASFFRLLLFFAREGKKQKAGKKTETFRKHIPYIIIPVPPRPSTTPISVPLVYKSGNFFLFICF